MIEPLKGAALRVVEVFHKPVTASIAGISGYISAMSSWYGGLAKPGQLLLVLGVFMILDLITGVMAAHKRGEPISSHGLRRSCEKIIGYGGCVIIVFGMTQAVEFPAPWDSLTVVFTIGAVIGIEALSVIENIAVLKIRRLGPLLTAIARLCRWPVERWKETVESAKEEIK
jgi:phage-related holin